MIEKDSFGAWIIDQVRAVLGRATTPPPLLVWCDPGRSWLELLRAAAEVERVEIWGALPAGQEEPELALRDRFARTPRAPRLVWLPRGRDEITWFKVFELEAEAVFEKSLLEALRDYGVEIAPDEEQALASLLPGQARGWFERPKSAWRELTLGSAKETLVSDERVLEALAGEEGEFGRLQGDGRFPVFARRVLEDFGLPDPTKMAEAAWRVAATARLLATEAAQVNPQNPPGEGDRVIPPGRARENSLKLLKAWQSNVHFIPSFERIAPEADKLLGLAHWARNLGTAPRSRASRAVEAALFEQTLGRLEPIEAVETLARELEQGLPGYQQREQGFWGRLATRKVGWRHLVRLADAASLLVQYGQAAEGWKKAEDALAWYRDRGWQLDQAGEMLFQEAADLPGSLPQLRARLRRGYLRALDQVGRAFSTLLAPAKGPATLNLPTPGEVAAEELARQKGPAALVFLDACRLDLGQRLARLLNEGEPAPRAEVRLAAAPVPSVTALGMAFALPMQRDRLSVDLAREGKGFGVRAHGFSGNLAVAAERRRWLVENCDVKEVLTIAQLLEGSLPKPPRGARRLIAVEGGDFDTDGHEGQLKLAGAEEHLERYARAIRRLREAGWSRVIVLTDHGFFHWQPEQDEIEDEKPGGDLVWSSRRAMVGRKLSHKSAIKLKVPCSDLEAMVPRSVNAFKTYGALGYFHGGATLQEIVVPVIVASWPAKASKIDVVLKPVMAITSLAPRVQVGPGMAGQGTLFGVDAKLLGRRVLVKAKDPASGKLVFRHGEPAAVKPGGDLVTVGLALVEGTPALARDHKLVIEVVDAEDEDLLAREEGVALKVDIDEW